MNIVEEIFKNAERSAVAIIAGDRSVTFGELEKLTGRAASALGADGAGRTGLHCPNGIDHIVWSLAVLKCGGTLVPIAPELCAVERDELADTTGLHTILCAGGKTWNASAPAGRELTVDEVGRADVLTGWQREGFGFDERMLNSMCPAFIRFSSGTTGARKGVVLSHRALHERVTVGNSHLKFGPGDRIVWILPMAHHFAATIILYLLHGATSVLENSHLGADVYAALVRHNGTALYASPFHYALLASCKNAAPVSSLRRAISTAAPLPLETASRFAERFEIPLQQALGVIECGLPLLNDQWASEKPESVGRPQTGYSFSIRDESGAEVPVGKTGALFLRGPGFLDAYLSPWMRREEILDNGWFRTGDHARADSDGAVTLCGRSGSMINVGGMKCFPEEVEAVLNAHPAVYESRVSGAAHPSFGSVPTAEIVPEGDAPKISTLSAWCRDRLSSHKRPVKFTFVKAIPKTPSGKIKR